MADIKVRGREREATVTVPVGTTLLEAAIQAKVDWAFSCTRGPAPAAAVRLSPATTTWAMSPMRNGTGWTRRNSIKATVSPVRRRW